ncbi:penicillin acylase family protein [Providencia hangzhouensis]
MKIERDSYGVPHIYADDTYSLWVWLCCHTSRLFQMEMATKHTGHGFRSVR